MIKSKIDLNEVIKGEEIYLKVGDKDNVDRKIKFKILSDAEIGHQWFAKANDPAKPEKKAEVYRHTDKELLEPYDEDRAFQGTYGKSKIKVIISMLVWDFNSKSIKILTIDKATLVTLFIQEDADEDLKDIQEYDWKITWEGQNKERTYKLTRLDPSADEDEIKNIASALKENKLDMDRYMVGLNPIEEENDTKAVEKKEVAPEGENEATSE